MVNPGKWGKRGNKASENGRACPFAVGGRRELGDSRRQTTDIVANLARQVKEKTASNEILRLCRPVLAVGRLSKIG
ncbi:MAG: hypothetical protein J6K20_03605 [Thermoguttaceae bacterium]|nr:hypothetical protein [Thermoguttaceae bacterium]